VTIALRNINELKWQNVLKVATQWGKAIEGLPEQVTLGKIYTCVKNRGKAIPERSWSRCRGSVVWMCLVSHRRLWGWRTGESWGVHVEMKQWLILWLQQPHEVFPCPNYKRASRMLVAHNCNPSYLGGWEQEDWSLRPALGDHPPSQK
jgi:hypothetical protein